MKLTDIHNIRGIKDAARLKLVKWSNEVEELGVDNFYIVINPSLTGKNIFHKFSGCFM